MWLYVFFWGVAGCFVSCQTLWHDCARRCSPSSGNSASTCGRIPVPSGLAAEHQTLETLCRPRSRGPRSGSSFRHHDNPKNRARGWGGPLPALLQPDLPPHPPPDDGLSNPQSPLSLILHPLRLNTECGRKYLDSSEMSAFLALYSRKLDLERNVECKVKVQTVTSNLRVFTSISG